MASHSSALLTVSIAARSLGPHLKAHDLPKILLRLTAQAEKRAP
jgi:hypothetical protein